MRNWPAGLTSLLTSNPTQLVWADLYTITLSTLNNPAVFDQFGLGSITSKWTANDGTFSVNPTLSAYALTAGGDGRLAMHWNRNSFLANQSSQAMLTIVPGSGGGIGPAVLIAASANTYYAALWTSTGVQLIKNVAGTVTTLGTHSYTPKVRDILYLERYNGLLLVKLNGLPVINASDSSITSGSPGLAALGTTTAGAVTNWVGNSIGARYMFTSWEEPVTLNGQTWQARGTSPNGSPLIKRSRLTFTKGTEVGEMDITFSDNNSVLIGNLPLLQAILQKKFDNATIELSLAAAPTSQNAVFQGPGSYFYGKVSDVSPGRTLCKITVKDKREEMNQQLPRRLMQQACAFTLFDQGCTLNAAIFAVAGTVAAGSNASVIQTNLTQSGPIAAPATPCSLSTTGGHAIPAQTYYVRATYITAQGETSAGPESNLSVTINNRLVVASPPSATGALSWNCYVSTVSGGEELQNIAPISIGTNFTMPDYQQSPSVGLPFPAVNQTGYFDLGYIVWLTGANAGTITAIRSYFTGGVISFYKPLANSPVTGDTFTIYPGCDKRMATCQYKFNNLINHGGMEFMPPPETTV